MIDVLTQTIIQRPTAEVSRYASDPDNAPNWYKNIRSVQWRTPKPLTIGSQIAFTAQFLGRKLEYICEVVCVTGEKLVMQTAQGSFSMETIYGWEDAVVDASGMSLRRNVKTPLGSPPMHSANRKDPTTLETHCGGVDRQGESSATAAVIAREVPKGRERLACCRGGEPSLISSGGSMPDQFVEFVPETVTFEAIEPSDAAPASGAARGRLRSLTGEAGTLNPNRPSDQVPAHQQGP